MTANTHLTRDDGLSPVPEVPVIQTRPHWAAPAKDMLPTIVIVIAVFWLVGLVGSATDSLPLLQFLLWSIAAVVVVYSAWQLLEWWKTVITVTSRRFIFATGIIVKTNYSMWLNKVADTGLKQSPIGQLLGYGTLTVESSGGTKVIEFVPEKFYDLLQPLIPS